MTEDEVAGWHHWLNGHEFEQTPGASEGQESAVCCSPWGHKELHTTEQQQGCRIAQHRPRHFSHRQWLLMVLEVIVSARLVSSEAVFLCRQPPSVSVSRGLRWHDSWTLSVTSSGAWDNANQLGLRPAWWLHYFVTLWKFWLQGQSHSEIPGVRASLGDSEGPPSAHHVCIRGSEWCTRECFSRQPLVQIVIISVSHVSRQKVEKIPASHVGHTCVL